MAKESRWTIVAFEAAADEEVPEALRPLRADEMIVRYDFRDGHEGRKVVFCKFSDRATMRKKGPEQARREFVRLYGGSIDGEKVVLQRNTVRVVY